jgi:hypothetical protein
MVCLHNTHETTVNDTTNSSCHSEDSRLSKKPHERRMELCNRRCSECGAEDERDDRCLLRICSVMYGDNTPICMSFIHSRKKEYIAMMTHTARTHGDAAKVKKDQHNPQKTKKLNLGKIHQHEIIQHTGRLNPSSV